MDYTTTLPTQSNAQTNRFSFKRLGLLLKYDFLLYKRSLWLTALVALSVSLLPLMLTYLTDVSRGLSYDFVVTQATMIPQVFSWAFFFFIFYLVQNKVNAFRTPLYIQLPASVTEKFTLLVIEIFGLSILSWLASTFIACFLVWVLGAWTSFMDFWREVVHPFYPFRGKLYTLLSVMIAFGLYSSSFFFYFSIRSRKYLVALLLGFGFLYAQVIVTIAGFFIFHIDDLFMDFESFADALNVVVQVTLYLLSLLFFVLSYRALARKQFKK